MAYTSEQHQAFADRVKNFMIRYQELREEAARLDAIYISESNSGEDIDFTDVGNYTETQLTNAISLFRDFKLFNENGSITAAFRTIWINPFLI